MTKKVWELLRWCFIILVLVGLAFAFKTQISGVANGVYDSIKSQVNSF